ncbi:hypothetical protein CFC21_053927 [Triticum aestivum]|uniref:Uncharacterized protein n=3 Tax=Triticum TaxID=4564 RepID=A0A9R0ZZL4_TRITD|nr:uncharacterized protein LOC119336695 [Triticum dicoccoides]KAF7044737.1 hypothetical protein CFC21_053927 [Triticum aestivum]VAI86019.1 unnamed protein product [Triticum turgidum subsp. durum]
MRPTAAAAAKPSFFLARHQPFPTSSRAAAAAADPCKSPNKLRRIGRSWRAASAGSNRGDERGQSVSTVATTPSGRRARLSARRRESIRLLDVLPGQGGIGEFLRHPAGVESLLNTRALQSFAPVESESESGPAGAFRCTLHPMGFLGFQVAPVLDLRVTPTRDDCTVEMLSCRFEGSDSIEQQNELFSAVMTNRITWGDNGDQEPCLDIDVYLEVTLEVYTKPFSLLPLSAVEKPGNLLMQGLLDRLVPMLGEQLLRDYHSWVQQQTQSSSS